MREATGHAVYRRHFFFSESKILPIVVLGGRGILGDVTYKYVFFTSANTPHKNRIVVTVVVTFGRFFA